MSEVSSMLIHETTVQAIKLSSIFLCWCRARRIGKVAPMILYFSNYRGIHLMGWGETQRTDHDGRMAWAKLERARFPQWLSEVSEITGPWGLGKMSFSTCISNIKTPENRMRWKENSNCYWSMVTLHEKMHYTYFKSFLNSSLRWFLKVKRIEEFFKAGSVFL